MGGSRRMDSVAGDGSENCDGTAQLNKALRSFGQVLGWNLGWYLVFSYWYRWWGL